MSILNKSYKRNFYDKPLIIVNTNKKRFEIAFVIKLI